jgi:sec1 family domain-containing protein 1
MTSAYSPLPGLVQPPWLSLREVQKRALLKVLSLNSDEEAPPQQSSDLLPQPLNGDPVWKFLVFDKLGQDVISSVLRVSDLREAGVTVHMQLKADRLQMEDVPASMPPPSPTFEIV